MSNGNLVSVEYSSHSPNDEVLNGIYTPQNNEEETKGDILPPLNASHLKWGGEYVAAY